MEIRKVSKILFHLNKAYYIYFQFKNRNLSNKEWQKIRWDDYGEFYYSTREDVPLDDLFLANFKSMAEQTDTVLEIGCGGFALTRQLAILLPDIKFQAVDISEDSKQIYLHQIMPKFKNIQFYKTNILSNIDILGASPFFYTHNVFMHFNEQEINEFFNYIQKLESPVFGILQEPWTDESMSQILKERDYAHNYPAYFKRYGFKLIDVHYPTQNTGIFYFGRPLKQ